jgi:UDP-N-acetylmuramoyl-tripeptide--D-alanyl-D-alanine ligase
MRLQPRPMGGAMILDDAYNANADSMLAALEALRAYPAQNRRFAVLGSMAELGAASREAHLQVGRHAAASGLAGLVLIGRDRDILAEGAREGGFGDAVLAEDQEHAARLVAGMVGPGDVVLVKASRSSQLEKVVGGLERLLGRGEGVETP